MRTTARNVVVRSLGRRCRRQLMCGGTGNTVRAMKPFAAPETPAKDSGGQPSATHDRSLYPPLKLRRASAPVALPDILLATAKAPARSGSFRHNAREVRICLCCNARRTDSARQTFLAGLPSLCAIRGAIGRFTKPQRPSISVDLFAAPALAGLAGTKIAAAADPTRPLVGGLFQFN